MKKKVKKNKIENAMEVVANLKANIEVFKEKGQNTEFIKTLDSSVRKLIKLESEIVVLNDRIKSKKSTLKIEKEQTFELVKQAKKTLKGTKKEKKGKKKKEAKVSEPEIVAK